MLRYAAVRLCCCVCVALRRYFCVESLCDGVMYVWSCGIMALLCYYVMLLWSYDVAYLWSCDVVKLRGCAVVELWSYACDCL